jgi:cell division protein FtsQ
MRRVDDDSIVISPEDRLGVHHPRRDTGDRGARREVGDPTEAERSKDKRDASQPRAKSRRKLVRPRLLFTPLQRMAFHGVLASALLVSGLVIWHSGLLQRTARTAIASALDTTGRAGFRVDEITVTGRSRTPAEDVIAALGTRHGQPIFGLDIGAAKDRLEALPAVRAAAVERRLPGSIHLAIVEREPVALWQHDGAFALIDRDGHQIPGGIEGFEDLPLVVGDGAPLRTDELLTLLATEPALASRVKAAVRVGNRRWNIRLDNAEKGLEARLPESDAESAWHRLAELERDRGLTAKQITMIDLRLPDRLVLKSEHEQPAAADHRRDNGA